MYHRLMDDFFANGKGPIYRENNQYVPAVNIVEHRDKWMLDVAAPGFSKEQFQVNLKENSLTISGKLVDPETAPDHELTTEAIPKVTTLHREFRIGSFERQFTLPETVDPDGISAHYHNGILMVTIPKKETAKTALQREIAIG